MDRFLQRPSLLGCRRRTRQVVRVEIIEMQLDCFVEHKCWEHYQGWYARITQRDIALAKALVKFRTEFLSDRVNDDSLIKLEQSVHLLRQIINAQWREMTRSPFIFEEEKPEKRLTKLDLADLGL